MFQSRVPLLEELKLGGSEVNAGALEGVALP